MTTEEWRAIPSCPGYEASNLGRIRSFKLAWAPGRVRATHVDGRNGYVYFTNHQPGRTRPKHVHAAVAEAFYGPRPDGMQVRHINGDKADNTAGNLRYGTPSENCLDQVRHGTHRQTRKTHCAQGHPFDEANTYWYGSQRQCRACSRASCNARYARRRSA